MTRDSDMALFRIPSKFKKTRQILSRVSLTFPDAFHDASVYRCDNTLIVRSGDSGPIFVWFGSPASLYGSDVAGIFGIHIFQVIKSLQSVFPTCHKELDRFREWVEATHRAHQVDLRRMRLRDEAKALGMRVVYDPAT